jgi:hypothetical protein
MAGSGEHVKALVRSHASGDDEAFYSVALQVAAQAARQGHHRLAADLKAAVENSRTERPRKVTSIAQPRGDLSDLVIASHPTVNLKALILPAELTAQVQRIIGEQRQRKQLLDQRCLARHRFRHQRRQRLRSSHEGEQREQHQLGETQPHLSIRDQSNAVG